MTPDLIISALMTATALCMFAVLGFEYTMKKVG